MESAAKLLFQSISSVYNSTISSSALQSQICFKPLNMPSYYYGIRLNDSIIPDRLIIRIAENKKEVFVDLLWLVNSPNFVIQNCALFSYMKKKITCSSNSREIKSLLEHDASVTACYDDLINVDGAFQKVLIGSKYCYFQKVFDEIGVEQDRIPTPSFAISRSILKKKELNNPRYKDLAINSFIAIIDIVQRSFELLSSQRKEKKNVNEMHCVRCGYKIPPSSYFCPFCGSKQ
ncbi:MAG: zinc ribbon domain-containing protein [Candidatus Heimdallarchaeaceae archaeon]